MIRTDGNVLNDGCFAIYYVENSFGIFYISGKDAPKKTVNNMVITEYNINAEYSGALITISGNHGSMKNILEDRIYLIVSGHGSFVIDGITYSAAPHDVFFVPKNTPYNFVGEMTLFLVCSPAFNKEHDMCLA